MTEEEAWDELCERAANEMSCVREFLETWGRHCGAPYEVFRGHLVKLLKEILEEVTGHEDALLRALKDNEGET